MSFLDTGNVEKITDVIHKWTAEAEIGGLRPAIGSCYSWRRQLKEGIISGALK
jgi:hypothetical protein